MIDNIYLCICAIGVDELNENKLGTKVLPKQEYCLCADGVFYNLIDFKRYKLFQDHHCLGEEYIIQVSRQDESKLDAKPMVKKALQQKKMELFNHIEETKNNIKNPDDLFAVLPHADIVGYEKGDIVFLENNIGIISKNKFGIALLYGKKYYDLNTGQEILTVGDDVYPGDEIGYNFKGITPEILDKEEYKKLILLASQLAIKLTKNAKSKVLVLR